MLCPVCKTQTLQMAERHGIEIDDCPSCRGVWLARGELDKIIERSAQDLAPSAPAAAAAPQAPHPAPQAPQYAPPPPHGYQDPYGHQRGYKPKRRKSFLEELFD